MISFSQKVRYVGARAMEACDRRQQKNKLNMSHKELAREEQARKTDSARTRFVLTFYNGRRTDNLDRSALDARIERELSELRERQGMAQAFQPDCDSSFQLSHPKPFRVAGVPVVKGSEMRQQAAKDWAAYRQVIDPPKNDGPRVILRAYAIKDRDPQGP